MIVSHVSHCLPMFAPVTVKSLSESHPGFSSLREPFPSRFDLGVVVVLLATGVVAEPLVAAGLLITFFTRGEADHHSHIGLLAADQAWRAGAPT
jgi:hypothetical protein